MFEAMIWGGAVLTALGLGAILWCIWAVWDGRRKKLGDAEMRARMSRVVAVNMAALGFSVIGLLLVAVGIILGS